MRAAGVAMVFVYLIVPGTIACLFTGRRLTQLPVIAAAVIIASAVGLTVSTLEQFEDFSMGPPIGVCMGVLLIAAALGKAAAGRLVPTTKLDVAGSARDH